MSCKTAMRVATVCRKCHLSWCASSHVTVLQGSERTPAQHNMQGAVTSIAPKCDNCVCLALCCYKHDHSGCCASLPNAACQMDHRHQPIGLHDARIEATANNIGTDILQRQCMVCALAWWDDAVQCRAAINSILLQGHSHTPTTHHRMR
jgi:hypothetical protein